MTDNLNILVGSSTDYDELIAEVKFGSIAGVIISKEPSDSQYMVSLHSFNKESADNFDYTRKVMRDRVPLNDLLNALRDAQERLSSLD